jgi:hypothetical protein
VQKLASAFWTAPAGQVSCPTPENKKQDDSCRPAFSIKEILLLKQNQASVKFDA